MSKFVKAHVSATGREFYFNLDYVVTMSEVKGGTFITFSPAENMLQSKNAILVRETTDQLLG